MITTASSPTLTQAWNDIDAIIRTNSKTFYVATNLLPKKQRDAIRALYAFCRATDDLVDRENATVDMLEAWRTEVQRPASQQTNPVLACWASVREQYAIDSRYEQELIDGVKMDLQFHPYPTWSTLETYCYHVASTVGLLSMPIIGQAHNTRFEQAAPYAIRLGIALQLTNILRDVGEDVRHGRVYLPIEDLQRFGLTIEDIRHHVYDERFIALMKFEIARARQLYLEALPGICLLSPSARPAVGAAALLYRAILDEIEAIDYQVYERRAHTTAWRKIALLPVIFWTILRLRRPSLAE